MFFVLCSRENSTKFRHEISSKRSRIFFESNEISLLSWRKFAMAIFPQCEILLEMEAGCNENPCSDCSVCCTCTCNCLKRSRQIERSSMLSIVKPTYATPKVTKYQRCHYIIQNHQITIKIDKININLLVVCVNIVEFNSISIPTCFMLCIINQETCFLNQDACFLNQEGRRQFLISFVSERD